MLARVLEWTLRHTLLVLGIGFSIANLRVGLQLLRSLRLRSRALLVWPGPRPAYHTLLLPMGLVLGLVIIVKITVLHWPPIDIFGETMMFVYYALLLPLSWRISRGFYEDGVWLDTGYIPYAAIGGLTWREEPQLTLLILPRMKQLARRLVVPREHYGAVRRLLREKIGGHDIHFTGKALDLGAHDERDDV